MTLYDEVRQERDRLLRFRRDIHRHPELSWQEFRTQKLITSELDALDIPYEKVCGTGVIAVIQSDRKHPVIALRADMDALPIEEKNEVDYASETPGVMHACGHDCHVAWLLVVARILKAHQAELACTVKLIFQPAEEVIEGAHAMAGLPQLEDVDHIFGAHAWNELPVGQFSAEEGPRFASADKFAVTIKGKSAHGAQPQDGVDAIVAASAVVQAIQTVVSRTLTPLESGVVSVGTIAGGTSANILADEVVMTGTVRSFNSEVQDQIQKKLQDLCERTAEAYGATCEFEYKRCTSAVINQPEETERIRGAVRKLFGSEALEGLEKTMGGEDFAWFMERIPGGFVRVGARNEAERKDAPHHSPTFDVDEEVLINGAAVLCETALSFGREA